MTSERPAHPSDRVTTARSRFAPPVPDADAAADAVDASEPIGFADVDPSEVSTPDAHTVEPGHDMAHEPVETPTAGETPMAGGPDALGAPHVPRDDSPDDSSDPEPASPDQAGSEVASPSAAEPLGDRVRTLVRDLGRRLSLRRTPPPPRVARVFDGHRDGIPSFAPERPVIVDQAERDALLTLLRSGSVLVHASRPLRDDLGDLDAAVPADLRSDGTWIWSDAVAYYLEHHWIAPDTELVAHLRAAGPAAPLDAATWRRLSAAIRPDAWEGTTWPLD
ncbi:hypothetical protein [Schumannella sp. 10F1B-5-1]|uniref:hypothetical protein n=1 Tax=Schumannella sp. 10F1B-5-1 TaxID=2590780 RepID=UPI0011318133|nr:hypothetical protein [Schumannella sp. 10F1B-5-1]TPW76684.1 hypothetical protein FJ658_01695 [Schumannella sp. 10F1B-5-1]